MKQTRKKKLNYNHAMIIICKINENKALDSWKTEIHTFKYSHICMNIYISNE